MSLIMQICKERVYPITCKSNFSIFYQNIFQLMCEKKNFLSFTLLFFEWDLPLLNMVLQNEEDNSDFSYCQAQSPNKKLELDFGWQ